jgi:hypothetical protein
MLSQMQQVVAKYVERLQEKSYVPWFSYESGLLRDDVGPNRLFFRYLLSHNATDSSRERSRLRAKLAIVLEASLTIFETRTSVRKGFRSCVSTGIFCVPPSHNPTDSSRARSRLRAKLAIVLGASLTIFKTWT